jgi:RNA polymerase sigma-70 factor (ECF subfamily)
MDQISDGVEMKNDEEIARLIQSGRVEFFDALVKRYEVKISRYARKFLSDKDDIGDVLQDIFIKVYTNIKSFDANRKFSSWIYRIAHNELVNALKKRKNKILPLIDLDIFLPYNISKDDFNKNNDQQDVKKIVEECLGQLTEKYKEIIILYYLEELSYKEIADILQIPVSTAGIRIKRGREMMQSIHKNIKHKYE